MNFFPSLFIIGGLGLSLAACSSIAPGLGGMAEHHNESLVPVEAGQKLRFRHGLRFDFESLKQQLAILQIKGAYYCFPAAVKEAKIKESRIAREIEGELFYDAANDIIIQRRILARLERQLDYVIAQEKCKPESVQIAGSELHRNITGDGVAQTLFDLLNSDNQFALDSFELNPKYKLRLAEAAVLLKQHQQYSLHISGHADEQGNETNNRRLSHQRAEKVAAYLRARGIEDSRLSITAFGQAMPLFDGNGREVYLVNRRVNVAVRPSAADH